MSETAAPQRKGGLFRRGGRKKEPLNYSAPVEHNTNNEDLLPSKTCMPFFQQKPPKSTASRTVPLSEQSDDENEQDQLLNSTSNDPLLSLDSWYRTEGGLPLVSETEAETQPQPDLLKLPTPTYRGRKGIEKKSSPSTNRPKAAVYEGEQEPDGVRGQEAKATIAPSYQRLSSSKSHGNAQTPSVRSFGPAKEAFVISPLSEILKESDDDDDQFEAHELSSSSTRSSADILNMRSDLDPSAGQSTMFPNSTDAFVPTENNFFRKQAENKRSNSANVLQRDVFRNPEYEADSSSSEEDGDSSVEEPFHLEHPYRKTNTSSARAILKQEQSSSNTSNLAANDGPLSPRNAFAKSAYSCSSSNGSTNSSQAVFASTTEIAPRQKPLPVVSPTRSRQQYAHEAHIDEIHEAAVRHMELGEYNHALSLFEVVLEAYIENYGKVHPLVASTRHNLGLVHSKRAGLLAGKARQNAWVVSLKHFQAAARCARDSLGPEHPNVAASLVRIGFLLMDCREYEKAIVTFDEALRIRLTHYGPRHGLVANLWNDLGVCHTHLQHWDDAMISTSRALETQRKLVQQQEDAVDHDKMHMEIADTLCNVGGLYLERMQHEGDSPTSPLLEWTRHAVSAFCEALAIRMDILGEASHPLVVQARSLHDMAQTSLRKLKRKQSKERDKKQMFQSRMAVEDDMSGRFRRDGSFENEQSAYDVPDVSDIDSGVVPKNSAIVPFREVMLNREPKGSDFSDDVDSLGDAPSPRRVPDGTTKIWVSPHVIPYRSVAQYGDHDDSIFSSTFVNDFYPQQEEATPGKSPRRQERTYAYDAEDSCMIGTDTEEEFFSCQFADDDNEGDKNPQCEISKHEIMVVQPTNSFDEKAVQPLESRKPISFSQGVKSRPLLANDMGSPTLTVYEQDSMFDFDGFGGQEYYAEADWGGGPAAERPVVNITREMMEEPESHLEEIHSAATRYLRENRLHEADILFETILQCQRNKHGELHESVGAALHNVGLVHLRAERHLEALDAFEKAVRVRKGSLGRDHPDVAVSLVKVGITLLLLHRFEMALMAFRDALSIRRHAMGSLHPSLSRIYNNIGVVHLEFNEIQEARGAFEGALDIQRNALCDSPESGPLMFGTATTLCNLGFLYKSRGMHAKAAVFFEEAADLQEAVLGASHPTVLSTLDNFADANIKCNNSSAALKCYHEILKRFPSDQGVGTSGASLQRRKRAEAVILYKMSRAHRKQNDNEAELKKLQAALDIVHEIVDTAPSANRKLTDRLERGIQKEINRAKEQQGDFEWI